MAFRSMTDLYIRRTVVRNPMDSQGLLGFAIFTIAFITLGMLTGACLMRRIDDLAHAIEKDDERYVN